jgi:small conductance mechanosensitive channel
VSVVILVAGYFLTKLVLKIAKKAMDKTKIDFSLEKFFLNLIKTACYIVLVISALSQMGISTTGLIAFFSAAAAAIALALKDSLSNIASGIILLFSKPFATGDFIEFDSDMGEVQQIDLIHTKVRTYDYKSIIIPNSVISNMEIINYSKLPHRRIDITVPVGYDADIEKVKKVLLSALSTYEKILNDPAEPFVRVNEFAESSVNLAVRVWVKIEDYWDVYYDIMEIIKSTLDKADIPIPYNQLDVHIN